MDKYIYIYIHTVNKINLVKGMAQGIIIQFPKSVCGKMIEQSIKKN